MAYRLDRWIAGAIAGCAVIAVVYLPPRGQPAWLRGVFSGIHIVARNESRTRAEALAHQWREVNAELRWLRIRTQVREATERRRQAGQFGPLALVEGPDTLAEPARALIQRALDSVWLTLGLRDTKISAVVQTQYPSDVPAPTSLRRSAESVRGTAYVLPDTIDRATCLVQSRLPFWFVRRRFLNPRDVGRWAGTVLGPCAYYARFGMPSARVERWLVRRRFDVAMAPLWAQPARVEGWWLDDFEDQEGLLGRQLRTRMMLSWLYSYPRATAACYIGRPEVCRRTIASSDGPGEGPAPRFVLPFDDFDPTKVQLVAADQFLAQVLRRSGGERFQAFWTTSLPVDSALSLAVGEPIGEFITEYHSAVSPLRPTVGAAPRPRDASLTLLVAGLFLGMVMLLQGRREAR